MKTRTIPMPFGKGYLDVTVTEKNLQKIYSFTDPPGLEDEAKEIERSLRDPLQSQPIASLVGPDDTVSILVSDITRPVPSGKIVSAVLRELRHVPRKNMTVIIATGLHRANTQDELQMMLGPSILNEVRVINHDAFDQENLDDLGKTSRGTELFINSHVRKADRIIATGYIEPHEFSGFTGGRKSLLPGVSGADTINHNHRLENIDHPQAKIGVLEGNPIHEDMVEAARMAGVDFIVNVVLNRKNRIAKVVAGDLVEAHQEGIDFYNSHARVGIDEPADIVITSSGYPLDINLYQAVKPVIAAEPFVKTGGIIILLAHCEDGFGEDLFHRWMTSFSSPHEVIQRIQKEGYRADIDHCYLLARILEKKEIVIVSDQPALQEIQDSLIKTTDSIDEALGYGVDRQGKHARIAFLPHATRMIPVLH
jgi:nickel-dependent lactate racemase